MKKTSWQSTNIKIIEYLEKNIFPNILAFTIGILMHNTDKINISFDNIYYNCKAYINITNENKVVVETITRDLLKKKFNIVIICKNPLKIKRIS